MDSRKIFGVDVGSYSRVGHFAWYELNSATDSPTPNNGYHDPVVLADHVIVALGEGRQIALGLEAPIWIPGSVVQQGLPPRMQERFPLELSRRWYAGAAATVGMMALSVLGDVLARLELIGLSVTVTDDFTLWEGTEDSILIYESFLVASSKPTSCGQIEGDEWDAFVTASLIWEYMGERTHLRSCPHPGQLQELQIGSDVHVPLWPTAVPNVFQKIVGSRAPITLAWL